MSSSVGRTPGPCAGTRVQRGARGFTLIELAVVIAVIAILSGLAVPSLRWLGSARQNIAGTRVRAALVFAQQWALSTGDSCWAEVDLGQERLSVYVEQRGQPGIANRVAMKDPLTRAPMVVQLGGDGVVFQAVDIDGGSVLRFDGDGVPHGAGGSPLTADGTVDLTGGNRVRVAHGTGLVTVDG